MSTQQLATCCWKLQSVVAYQQERVKRQLQAASATSKIIFWNAIILGPWFCRRVKMDRSPNRVKWPNQTNFGKNKNYKSFETERKEKVFGGTVMLVSSTYFNLVSELSSNWCWTWFFLSRHYVPSGAFFLIWCAFCHVCKFAAFKVIQHHCALLVFTTLPAVFCLYLQLRPLFGKRLVSSDRIV